MLLTTTANINFCFTIEDQLQTLFINDTFSIYINLYGYRQFAEWSLAAFCAKAQLNDAVLPPANEGNCRNHDYIILKSIR
jgi:hypothetical protein